MDIKVLVKNPEGKEWLGRLACRWDSKAYFYELWFKDVPWFILLPRWGRETL